jgi:L-rhamnose mutarotase
VSELASEPSDSALRHGAGRTTRRPFHRIALHTRLKPGKESEYEEVHATIPAELDAALRAAGVHAWRIWRDGRDLFHVVDVEDYKAMRAALRDHPANVPWQARMAELLEVEDDYSGADTGLDLVWELP